MMKKERYLFLIIQRSLNPNLLNFRQKLASTQYKKYFYKITIKENKNDKNDKNDKGPIQPIGKLL